MRESERGFGLIKLWGKRRKNQRRGVGLAPLLELGFGFGGFKL